MGQLLQSVIYFNDAVGRSEPGAQSFFYEAGTTTDKTVYANKALTIPLPQPVVADAAGIFPDIYLAPGSYRWVIQDANGVQIDDKDNQNETLTVLNTSSNFYFNNDLELTQGILYNGESIDLQNGQVANTVYSSVPNDGLGNEYVIQAVDSGGDLLLNNGRYAHITGNQKQYALRSFSAIVSNGSSLFKRTSSIDNVSFQDGTDPNPPEFGGTGIGSCKLYFTNEVKVVAVVLTNTPLSGGSSPKDAILFDDTGPNSPAIGLITPFVVIKTFDGTGTAAERDFAITIIYEDNPGAPPP
jgi:hypothetical protein